MSFRLRVDEAVPDGLLRILRKQLVDALQRVEDGRRVSDKDVHAARKAIKRARATLRLLRPALTASAFKSTNAMLRDAARPLAHVRDAKALLDTMGSLRDYFADTANCVAPQDLERQLRAQKQKRRREIMQNRKLVDTLRRSLRKVAREVGRWSLDDDDWAVLGPGMKRIYRSGLKALTRASAEPSDECLHEWRKQVKHLWHALQIIEPVRPGVIGEMADQAHKLADYLGDDHDLAVLRAKVAARADDGDEAGRALLALIDMRRHDLQDRALTVGERLYVQRPKRFVARIQRHWVRWRNPVAPANVHRPQAAVP